MTTENYVNKYLNRLDILSPDMVVLFIDDIMKAVTRKPLNIDQDTFTTLVRETDVFLNIIDGRIDINNPHKALVYFKNQLEPIKHNANKFSHSEYKEALTKAINTEPIECETAKNKRNLRVKASIQKYRLQDILSSIELIKNSLFYQYERINTKLNSYDIETQEPTPDTTTTPDTTDFNQRIFKSLEGFEMFKKCDKILLASITTEQDTSEALNFLFKQLKDDNYIHDIGASEFVKFINSYKPEKYNIIKIKEGYGKTKKVEADYKGIKDDLKR